MEFRGVGLFLGEGKTRVPVEKPLRAEKRTNNNKLDPHDNVEGGNRTLGHISGEGVLSSHHPCTLKNGCMTVKLIGN